MPVASVLPRWSFRAAVLSAHSGLPAVVRLVMLGLDSYRSDQSPVPFPSQASLAAITGLSVRSVRGALGYAAEHGWVRRRKRLRADGGRTSDYCEMLIPPDMVQAPPAYLPPTPPAPAAYPPRHLLPTPPAPVAEEVVKTKRPTKNRTASAASRRAEPWLKPFVDRFREAAGEPNPGQLAKVMAPIVKEAGEATALEALTHWLTSDDVRFGVNNFGTRWKHYLQPGNGKPSRQAANDAVIDAWEREHGVS